MSPVTGKYVWTHRVTAYRSMSDGQVHPSSHHHPSCARSESRQIVDPPNNDLAAPTVEDASVQQPGPTGEDLEGFNVGGDGNRVQDDLMVDDVDDDLLDEEMFEDEGLFGDTGMAY